MPRNVVTELTENLTIQGVAPLTSQMLIEILNNFRRDINEDIRTNQVQVPIQEIQPEEAYRNWNWGGKLCRPFPPDFRFIKCTPMALWMHWFYGLEPERIRPFRYFKEWDFEISTDKVLLVKARCVINTLVDIAIIGEFITSIEDLYTMDKISSQTIFEQAYEFLIDVISKSTHIKRKRRYGELHYSTIYENINDYNIFFDI